MAAMNNDANNKIPETDEHFIYNRPIYIELPNEKKDLTKTNVKTSTT